MNGSCQKLNSLLVNSAGRKLLFQYVLTVYFGRVNKATFRVTLDHQQVSWCLLVIFDTDQVAYLDFTPLARVKSHLPVVVHIRTILVHLQLQLLSLLRVVHVFGHQKPDHEH